MTPWRIILRDRNLRSVGEIDGFDKLELVVRHNLPDSWILDLPATHPLAADIAPGSGIIIRRGAETIASGPLEVPERAWSADAYNLTGAGVSDDIVLEDRLAYPSAPPYDSAAYDVRTGPAETVLRGYVDANAAAGALLERQVAGLELEAVDLGRGGDVTGRARFDVLGDLLRSLALAGGDLGFRVVQQGAALVFEVFEPRDLSATAVFSPELGNLQAFKASVQVSKPNYEIVGGGGEGAARVFREGSDPAAIARWNRRIEAFRDRRDTFDADELDQTVAEDLANGSEKTALSITPIDTEAVTFGRDYTLGDQVTVVVDGEPTVGVVREVKFTVTGDGETIDPTIGTPGASRTVNALFDAVRRLGRKVSHLERI